jgi:ubiquinone/menaquinone biosynthesis C-methylase UbiE
MLAEAAAKNVAPLILAAAEAIPVADATLDYVVSGYCFHHFRDKDRALDEVTRVLSPGGVYRINNIAPEAAGGWWVYDFFPETMAIDATRFWPAAHIAEALESRGFSVAVDLAGGTHDVPAAEALADAERRVISQLAELDDAADDRGLARLRAHAGATVTTTRSRLCLTARRMR